MIRKERKGGGGGGGGEVKEMNWSMQAIVIYTAKRNIVKNQKEQFINKVQKSCTCFCLVPRTQKICNVRIGRNMYIHETIKIVLNSYNMCYVCLHEGFISLCVI